MRIALLVYDRMTALDAVGPYDSLSRLPEADIVTVSPDGGPVTCGGGIVIQAAASLDNVDRADVLIVPGGMPSALRGLLGDAAVMEWLRRIDQTSRYTCSVCTGALLLASAGVLRNRAAATHWRAHDALAALGATPVADRVHVDGKYLTSGGVSAGIDMGLVLCGLLVGRELGEAIELSMHYAPQPPFGTGNPATALTPARRQLIEERLRN